MNIYHRRLCRSEGWSRVVREAVVPHTLADLELGAEVLEIGPGFGATTSVMAERCPHLTAIEYDPALAARLEAAYPQVTVVQGDGAAMPFGPDRFSAVVCFTMLHHLANPAQQDRLFAEALRVLQPGGVFAGSDSLLSWRTRLIHLADTFCPVEVELLPGRLERAGFVASSVAHHGSTMHFRARKPPGP